MNKWWFPEVVLSGLGGFPEGKWVAGLMPGDWPLNLSLHDSL